MPALPRLRRFPLAWSALRLETPLSDERGRTIRIAFSAGDFPQSRKLSFTIPLDNRPEICVYIYCEPKDKGGTPRMIAAPVLRLR
jgi:hypothetical protein